jgi:adenine-specific DNA-methyltransferase
MEKIKSLSSADIVADNIEILKQLFPTIVKENRIDLNELKALLGESIEEKEEYYRFTWAGKNQARLEANKPSTATLRPDKESSKDWDTTDNIFIEGDNLEVLKLLQKSYANQIKLIYIDPPYNTGKDFVYKDNYSDNLGNYLELTGQVDEAGKKLSTNTESDGRYHSNWLSMMYPRLRLARNLMRDDGAIFISIDDNEVHNLKKLCDEVFGEENFVTSFMWKRKKEISSDSKNIAVQGEYILSYTKTYLANFNLEPLSEKYIRESYKDPTENFPLGKWRPVPITVSKGLSGGGYNYVIKNPNGTEHNKLWAYPEDSFKKLAKENKLYYGKDGKGIPQRVIYAHDSDGQPVSNYWDDVATNKEGKKEILDLFQDNLFDTPKPNKLISKIMNLSLNKEETILDFFAGSGTTAHAVMKFNSEDGGTRKCISVQLPEPTDEKSEAFKAGYKNIAEITKERIRRAGKKIKEDFKDREGIDKLDIGFKAFKLDSSNIQAWDGNPDNLEAQLEVFSDNIKEGRTEEDILFEILLKYGLDLTVPIEEKKIANKTVYNVGFGTLFICLADGITPEVSEGIGAWKQELNPTICRVIFKDTGFHLDKDKTNAIQILKRFGIEEVNSI